MLSTNVLSSCRERFIVDGYRSLSSLEDLEKSIQKLYFITDKCHIDKDLYNELLDEISYMKKVIYEKIISLIDRIENIISRNLDTKIVYNKKDMIDCLNALKEFKAYTDID